MIMIPFRALHLPEMGIRSFIGITSKPCPTGIRFLVEDSPLCMADFRIVNRFHESIHLSAFQEYSYIQIFHIITNLDCNCKLFHRR